MAEMDGRRDEEDRGEVMEDLEGLVFDLTSGSSWLVPLIAEII